MGIERIRGGPNRTWLVVIIDGSSEQSIGNKTIGDKATKYIPKDARAGPQFEKIWERRIIFEFKAGETGIAGFDRIFFPRQLVMGIPELYLRVKGNTFIE